MVPFAAPKIDRTQFHLFSPTLDAMIPQDHPVRLLDELLGGVDWSCWEARYAADRSRPPYHPRVVASVLLYGLRQGMRGSRRIEYACTNSLDFLWLAEGRSIDHTTICRFRLEFDKQLRSLFRQVCQIAIKLEVLHLVEIGLDGTRTKANSSRHETRSGKTIEKRLAELEAQLAQALAEMDEADRQDQSLFGDASPNKLPRKLATLQKRKEALTRARDAAAAVDERRRQRKGGTQGSAKVPIADPDSAVLSNKEGGYAPNYTPMAAVDATAGFIVDVEVTASATEHETTVATMDRIEEAFGQRPARLLADGHHATGENLEALEQRQIEVFSPTDGCLKDNPARRADPTRPVPEADWPRLPRRGSGKNHKLAKMAFVYVADRNEYRCAMGRALGFDRWTSERRGDKWVRIGIYRCGDCSGCPLAGDCLDRSPTRTVRRDEYEPLREAMEHRLATPEGEETYKRRKWICETPLAIIKQWLGLRQFLLRGLEKVNTEWLWTCTAFNLNKLIRLLTARRREAAQMAAEAANLSA